MEKIPLWLLRVVAAIFLAAVIYTVWTFSQSDDSTLSTNIEVTEAHVGTPAVDFAVAPERVANKAKFQLSSVKGYPIILHFWATWCGPCVQELPELLKLAKQIRPQGFSIIAVAVDDSWETVEHFFLKHPNLKELRDHTVLILDPSGTVANLYGVSRFPETLLINRGFIIDNKMVGAQPWTNPKVKPYLERLQKGTP